LYDTSSGWISLALGQDPCTQTRPSHLEKTLALGQDPCTRTRPLHSDKTLALGQDPCTQTMTSLNICTWLSVVNSTLASIHHHLLLSELAIPHLWLSATRPTITHVYHGLSLALWFLSLLRQGMECGGRWDNEGQGATWRQ